MTIADPDSNTARPPGLTARLWRDWVRPHWPRLILAMVLMICVAGLTGTYPLIIRWAVALLEHHDGRILTLAPALIILVTAAKALALYGQTLVTNALGLRIVLDMQKAMFSHLLRADFALFATTRTGTLVSRFTNDLNLVREALVRAASNLVRDGLTVIIQIVVLFSIDWLLALLIFLIYPLASLPVIRIGRTIRALSARTQEQTGTLTALLGESFDGARMVKTYGLENYENKRGAAAFKERYDLFLGLTKSRARIDPIMEVLGGMALAGVLVFAGWRASTGVSPVSDLMGFIVAFAVLAPSARALGTLNAVWQEGSAALARVFSLLDARPQIKETPDAPPLVITKGALRFDHVSFSYGDGSTALKDISFSIKGGQSLALVGPSGAGKSTVLNLVARLYDPTSGTVFIDDQDSAAVRLSSLRGAMALVSQDAILFDDTIAANIAFGRPDASQDDIIKAASAAAAHDFIVAQPLGYDTRVGERGQNLSGGQRQRIALARAILRDAPILLLDEATSALDADAEEKIQTALHTLSSGRTTIKIAHNLASIKNADHILVLDQGRVVEQGAHAALAAQNGLYAHLLQKQFIG